MSSAPAQIGSTFTGIWHGVDRTPSSRNSLNGLRELPSRADGRCLVKVPIFVMLLSYDPSVVFGLGSHSRDNGGWSMSLPSMQPNVLGV